MEIVVRAALPEDTVTLVELMLQAADDILQFILDEIEPRVTAGALLKHMISSIDSECSYRRCWVALAQSGAFSSVVGMVNAFPASLLCDQNMPSNLSARDNHLWPRTALQDCGSYCINSLAVFPLYRRRGIASRLIEQAGEQAIAEGFASLSLHVWADNKSAIRLYRRMGFQEIDRAAIPWHPHLPHSGGSLLMRLSDLAGHVGFSDSCKKTDLSGVSRADDQGVSLPSYRLASQDRR